MIPVKVTFDQPMDPNSYGVTGPGTSEPFRGIALLDAPTFSMSSHSFTLMLNLPTNWNGEVVLKGFRSKDGIEAAPLTLRYRTCLTPIAESLIKRQTTAALSETLVRVVEQARETRRKLTSVSELVRSRTTSSTGSPDWDQNYDVRVSRFKMQGDRQFVGEIDAIMGMPFRVGSDGKECWLRWQNNMVVTPFKTIEEKNLTFCDPFDANGPDDAAQFIRNKGLVYEGEKTVEGRRCHYVRGYLSKNLTSLESPTVFTWQICSETHLPTGVGLLNATGFRWAMWMEFTYSWLNHPILDEEFRPSGGPANPVVRKELEPLGEGYERRYLNVIDGSRGRMSVRWGKQGGLGTSSGGLN